MGDGQAVKREAPCVLLFLAVAATGCGGGRGGSDAAPVPAADYSLIFNRDAVDEYELVFTASNWQGLQNDPFVYVTGTLKFKDETYYSVGIRYKGNSSFFGMPPPKKPFKVEPLETMFFEFQ